MGYLRVIPRDLFNEAKLLKCMGRLCLLIEDRMTPVPMSYSMLKTANGFDIDQSPSDGSLMVMNITVRIKKRLVLFACAYNSKDNYSLWAEYDEEDYKVFDEKGEYHKDFIALCQKL